MGALQFRRDRSADSDVLDSMTLEGARHWEYDYSDPVAYEGLRSWLERGEPREEIIVVEDRGEVVAFYGLVDEGTYVELRRLYLKADRIGTGLGRQVWLHAVATARRLSPRLRILSDPGASGFYKAMGAVFEKDWEAHPGFVYRIYWYDLLSD